jgi:thioredoxin reductase
MIKNLIIGAGPAGIQMGHFFHGKEDYLIVEKGSTPCDFFKEFPRQRRFISINKSKSLKYDWNSFIGSYKSLRDYTEAVYPSADKYLEYVNDFVRDNNTNIRFGFEVTKIEKLDGVFIINDGELKAERVFFGTGLKPKKIPKISTAKGIKMFTYGNMPLDPEVYRDKVVHIIGTGNAALETADYVESWSDSTEIWGNERKAWTTHYPGHLRSVNFRAIDSYHLKARTVFHFGEDDGNFFESNKFNIELRSILEGSYPPEMANKLVVIWCTGFEFDSHLVKDLVLVDKFPVLTCNFESTKCPGLFFIGALTQHHDYKKGTSAFIHGFRYNCEYLYKYITNNIKYVIIRDSEQLTSRVFNQLNNSSALFHRFDQFCDLIGISEDGFHYIHEIPIQAVEQYVNPKWLKYFTVKLGYTNKFAETIRQTIAILPRKAYATKFIHPIIQYNSLVFHIPEEALNEFNHPEFHRKPFVIYLAHIMDHLTLDEVKMHINQLS